MVPHRIANKSTPSALITSLVVCGILITAFSFLVPVKADWSQLSHDERHQSYTTEIVDAHELKWITKLSAMNQSEMITSPIIYKGKVIVSNLLSLYVLDLETGKELWNITTKDIIFNTPAVAEDIIVVGTSAGSTYGISIEGEELWELPIVSSIPTISEGRAYLSGLYAVHCVDIRNGEEIWKFPVKYPATPSICNKTLIFGTNENGTVYAVHKDTAALLWAYPTTDDGIMGAPALNKERVYFSTYHWVDHDTVSGHHTALDINGTFLWDFHLKDSIPGAPAVAYGKVFFGTVDWTDNTRDDLKFFALDSTSGTILWTLDEYDTKATPAVSNHKIYFPAEKTDQSFVLHVCYVDTGITFWEYDFADNRGVISPSSSPTIANGTLVVGGLAGEVLAIGSKEPRKSDDGKGNAFFITTVSVVVVVVVATGMVIRCAIKRRLE